MATDVKEFLQNINFSGIQSNSNQSYSGVFVRTAQSIVTNTWTYLQWSNVLYDTDGCFDLANPTRLTIPSGYSFAKFFFYGPINESVTYTFTGRAIYRNRSTIVVDGTNIVFSAQHDSSGSEDETYIQHWPAIPVVAGDYFEAFFCQNSGATRGWTRDAYFGMELIR